MQSDRNSLPPKLPTRHHPLLTLPSFQPIHLEGMNGVERRQQDRFQAIALRGELGCSPEGYLAQLELWTPAEQLREPSTEEGRWPEKRYLRAFVFP